MFDFSNCYKITTYDNTCTVLDNRFRLHSVNQEVIASGQGFTSSGFPTTVSESNSFNVNYPVSGENYSRSSGFTKYVRLSDGSGGGTTVHLTIERVDTSQKYNFSFGVSLSG